jgi:hypothetical protein
MFHAFVLVQIFAMNALLFVPLGQRMGVLFNALPRLTAYAWDLAGSLSGTLCFGLFSLKLFSPVLGMAAIMAIYMAITARRWWLLEIPVFAAVLAAIVWNGDPKAIWSPYYYITINKFDTPGVTESAPTPETLAGHNPPVYLVRVNQFGYHFDASLDPIRYSPGTAASNLIDWIRYVHIIPYAVTDGRDRVLVVGAGGGSDVEVALDSGARHIDAVEIDPAIIDIARRFNAGAPYSDPRVSVHIDDARSYIAKARPGYDLVVYGFLDSQALFSTMNNVRLDGYVYTVEGIRSAFRLLGDHGVLALSFYLGKPWLGPKLYELVAEATGREPTMYLDNTGLLTLCVPRDPQTAMPQHVFRFTRSGYVKPAQYDLPTDDWPFLYLIRKTIPSDYLIAIAACSPSPSRWSRCLRRPVVRERDLHFGLLGMGFLLLETKSISDSTLFFGATWFVTMVVVSGVLLMVIAANLVAERLRGSRSGCTRPSSPSSRSCWSCPGRASSSTISQGACCGRSSSCRCPCSSRGSSSRRHSGRRGLPVGRVRRQPDRSDGRGVLRVPGDGGRQPPPLDARHHRLPGQHVRPGDRQAPGPHDLGRRAGWGPLAVAGRGYPGPWSPAARSSPRRTTSPRR